MDKTMKQDSKIMEMLKVETINRVICSTDKGYLTLQIRKGDNKYHLCLDSVPLSSEANKELMDILFAKPQMDIPQVNKSSLNLPTPLSFNGVPIVSDKIKPKGKSKAKNK